MPHNEVRNVNEFRSSRLCARCFTPFPLATLNHRFKVCDWCVPDQNDWPDGLKLPRKIVSKKSKRMYQMERRAVMADPHQAVGFVSKVICHHKNWRQNRQHAVDQHDGDFTADYEPEDFFDMPNEPILKTIWQRDISAAKLILYRGNCLIIRTKVKQNLNCNVLYLFLREGHCELFGDQLHRNFARDTQLQYPRWINIGINQ